MRAIVPGRVTRDKADSAGSFPDTSPPPTMGGAVMAPPVPPPDPTRIELVQALARRLETAPRRPWPDRPVPVALVITELDVGGAERALVALATGLDRRRWAPSVVGLGG